MKNNVLTEKELNYLNFCALDYDIIVSEHRGFLYFETYIGEPHYGFVMDSELIKTNSLMACTYIMQFYNERDPRAEFIKKLVDLVRYFVRTITNPFRVKELEKDGLL